VTSTQPPDAAAVAARDGQLVRDVVPFGHAVRAWFAISLQTFGGPAGQIAVMQRHLVDERRWIGQRRFLHALNYCMLLPGPEAQQLAIYVGWLLNGLRGGLVAGTLFVLPGVVALLALSAVYVGFGDTTAVTALFAGLAPAVVAIVVQGRLACRQPRPDQPGPCRIRRRRVRRPRGLRRAVPDRDRRRGRSRMGSAPVAARSRHP
jgi:chromate transporter